MYSSLLLKLPFIYLEIGTIIMNHKEKQILTAINQKNPNGWEFFYEQYYASLCSFVANILKQQEDVEDLVQDIYIAIWEGERTFSDIKELTNYLYRACYNNALLYIRNHQLHNDILEKIQQKKEEEKNDQEEEFYTLAVKEEVIRQLYNYITELPREQQRIILMRIEGYSWEEIALRLGVSINTIKTQRSRSFKFLRNKLNNVEYTIGWIILLWLDDFTNIH